MHVRHGSAYSSYPCAGIAYVPVYLVPVEQHCCNGGSPMRLPHSIEADEASTSQTVIVGGTGEVSLSIEYLIEDGAAAPTVKVTTAFGGGTSTWSAADTAPGYHVEDALLSVKPGTKVTLAVTEAMARIRWCEAICC
jgi:hypothetical protein